jgi:hypothetical protein
VPASFIDSGDIALNSLRTAAIAAIGITLALAAAVPAVADDTTADVTGPTTTVSAEVPNMVGVGVNTLSASATDPSGVSRVEWWVDGALRSEREMLYYDFGAEPRSVVVEFRAWDRIGNQSVTRYPVTVDTLPPVVASFTPAANSFVRGTNLTATVRLSDPSGVFYAVPLSGTTGGRYAAPFTANFPLPTEDPARLGWYVMDVWGNATNVFLNLTADSIKPKLAVTKAPANKAKVKGTVAVTASASDRYGIARVELLVNGKVAATDSKAGYQFSLNTKKYAKTIKIQLRTYDKAGNVTATPVRTWYR